MDLSKYGIEWVPVSGINADDKRFQFRVTFTTEDLEESFKENGQEEPIILWRRNNGELVVISGQRRFQTVKKLGFDKVMAIAIPESDISEKEAEDFNIDDNIRRKSLTEVDIMNVCIRKLKGGESTVKVSKMTQKGRTTISDYKLIGESPQEIQEAVKHRKISIKNVVKALRQGEFSGGGVSAADRGGMDEAELKQKWHENSMRLVDALKSQNPQESLQNLLNEHKNMAVCIDEIPEFLNKFKSAVVKQKDFDTQEVQQGGQQGTQKAAGHVPVEQPSNDMHVKETSKGCDLHLSIDMKRDTLVDLYKKAEFLKMNAKSMVSSAKALAKAYKKHKLKKQRQAEKAKRRAAKKAQKQAEKQARIAEQAARAQRKAELDAQLSKITSGESSAQAKIKVESEVEKSTRQVAQALAAAGVSVSNPKSFDAVMEALEKVSTSSPEFQKVKQALKNLQDPAPLVVSMIQGMERA